MAAKGGKGLFPDTPRSKCGRGLAPDGGLWADQGVGSDRVHIRGLSTDGYPSDTPRSKCGRGLAPDGGLWADQDVGLDRVHIRFCGHGCYGFRSYSGSLLKSAKVSKTLLPHHSAPRSGSACPHSGLNPWAAAMGHPWPSAANPASCRVTHGFKPAFGQRGLTGRLRSRSKARSRSRATRFASWLALVAAALCGFPCPIKKSHFMVIYANV
ncbi:Threonine synthase [Pseudomonas orientalis]|nr:Threonine synthase [Pseudomonas orientalis]